MYVLGLDGGGSKTTCVILDSSGNEIARAVAGASNHQSVGIEHAEQALDEAILATRKAAGDPELASACWGMAGLDRPEDEVIIQEVARRLLPGIPIDIVHDSTNALVGGTGGEHFGVVIISGTGSIAVGYHPSGTMQRAGGWGHLLGDEGSGHEIALRGLNAATRAYDGRGPETNLVNAFVKATKVSTFESLAARIYLQDWTAPEIAALAPAVLTTAEEGDQVAQQILEHASQELALAARVVIQSLDMVNESFNVVLAGGIFSGSSRMVEATRRAISSFATQAKVILPLYEPVIGAGMIALNNAEKKSKSSG
jgi:N-acetylglucosamine kinase